MIENQSGYTVNLFYSYSHKDSQHRESMERALAMLKGNGMLVDWSDHAILPGQSISAQIRHNMDNAEIIVFLLSQDFLASEECMKEWEYAKELKNKNPQLFRLPIIVRQCAWKDLLVKDDLKALPMDGVPVTKFASRDDAWHQVYEGVKSIVTTLRNSFTPRPAFLAEMERTDFISQESISLKDIFVFPRLLRVSSLNPTADRPADIVLDQEELLREKYSLIHGEERSGKTALGRNLFISLTEQEEPVLYVDLDEVTQKPYKNSFSTVYYSQFSGDFNLWSNQPNKTVIMDNLSGRSGLVDLVSSAIETFDRVIITSSSNIYHAFFRDEVRLAQFEIFQITDLSQNQQEVLIRKRLSLSTGTHQLTDGYIDKIEDRINSIIIDNKVVPRFPFFVLSILQTYEAFMPSSLAITSYGHCYYVLIIASLVRAGISRQDSDIDACLQFAEYLAFETYMRTTQKGSSQLDFEDFVKKYRKAYFLSISHINRLKNEEFGLINSKGEFRTAYMQHFFLGRYLSFNYNENRKEIQSMCDAIHVSSNYLTLLFIIHHSREPEIIDEILLRVMCTLDNVAVASLNVAETRRFQSIVSSLPKAILSPNSVESERQRVKDARDELNDQSETQEDFGDEGSEAMATVNGIYRVLKSNEIIGQILRNKHGSLPKERIEEIIEIMADGGLRLVNLFLKDEEEITDMAQYISARNSDYNIQQVRRDLEWFSFVWTLMNVEHIVKSVYVPEIRPAIDRVSRQKANPAYDVIGYFTMLDAAPKLTPKERKKLARLWKKHQDPFLRSVLSLRTQRYINTHRSDARVEQSVCALLGIRYVARQISQ